MNRMQRLAVFILLVALPGSASADSTRVNFVPGSEKGGPEAIVVEFLDPGATGLGKSLSYVIWREVASAIGYPMGTDVIWLHSPETQDILEQLKQGRHQAALDIAQRYQTPMVLWGEVKIRGRGSRARVTVQTSLTLNPKGREGDLSLRFAVRQGERIQSFQAEPPRTRFDFTRVRIGRTALFTRKLFTHTKTTLHTAPSATAPVAAHVATGNSLQAIDMQGTWFKVQHNGAIAYIDGSGVQVLPRRVDLEQPRVSLREGPGAEYQSTKRVDTQGAIEILAMRDHIWQDLWYKLRVKDTEGWLPGTIVRPRYDLPAEHFMTCLSSYRVRRFETAYRACSQFLATRDIQETNANLATAYQVQGASRLVFKDPFAFDAESDVKAFSKAVALTPYDPAAYNLRALVQFGVTRRLDGVLADLKQALNLDPENLEARAFVRSLVDVAGGDTFDLPNLDWIEPFLSVERIRQGRYHPLPEQAHESGPSPVGEGVLLTLGNHTHATLYLHLVGNVTRTLEVPAGQSEDVSLTAGTYAIAAEFSPSPDARKVPKARPLYGIQTYDPKTHYELTFYVRRRSGG